MSKKAEYKNPKTKSGNKKYYFKSFNISYVLLLRKYFFEIESTFFKDYFDNFFYNVNGLACKSFPNNFVSISKIEIENPFNGFEVDYDSERIDFLKNGEIQFTYHKRPHNEYYLYFNETILKIIKKDFLAGYASDKPRKKFVLKGRKTITHVDELKDICEECSKLVLKAINLQN